MLLLDLFETTQLSKTVKLWVNGPEKKIIVVPTEYHHTQFVYMKPPKFGLSGKLFAGHTYPMNTSSLGRMEAMPYDQVVGKEMFDRGWVRVNADNNEIDSLHGNNLKIIAQALGHLKRNNYNTDLIIIGVGDDIDTDIEYILNDPKEIRLFMRNGVMPRKRINENAYSDWKTWWLNPQVGDQLIPLSGKENNHWTYVKSHYMDMVADRRGARNLIDNHDLDEDNEAFYKLVDMVYNSGWVRVGRLTEKKMYISGSDEKSMWLATKRIMKELDFPEVSIDLHNVETNEWVVLQDDTLYRYLKTRRIPKDRVTAAGLEESVGENLLYHGTLLYKATRILQDKVLNKARISRRHPKINPKDLKKSKREELGFSMSRDPNLNYSDGGKGNAEIIFVFRKDVLARNFVIRPFDFAGSATHNLAGWVEQREESEEIIYGSQDRPIPVNNRTVAKIIIRPLGYGENFGDLDLLRQLAKEANIPVEDTQ